MRILTLITTISLLFSALATPLVDVVKNQVQVLGGKGHPEDALIHLIRTDDLLDDHHHNSHLLQRQSHLVFKIHYDEPDHSIYINGGKIDLADESLINSDEPLHAGPVVKVESLTLSPEEINQADDIKQEHIDKLPKGIVAAQLRLKGIDIDENTRLVVVYIKVLEDNAEHHLSNPIFTLQVTQQKKPEVADSDAVAADREAHRVADKEAFIAHIKEKMNKVHQKMKMMKLAHKHQQSHSHSHLPPLVTLKHGNQLKHVPCKMHQATHNHKASHKSSQPCFRQRFHSMVANLASAIHNASFFSLFLISFFGFWSCATLAHLTVALKRARAARHQQAYERVPGHEQENEQGDKQVEKV
ncbi:hypothetical protein E3P81_00492 [Wallemia ichthyophaga]|nr:hypothetical protein E3P97_00494 [Wallemia ichthyophaga]TIB32358.1 hypothetical protein E3P85_01870 [Wallemia ichthyophaga]TIB50296.1 hypothetical protein E3P82_00544 [Wallemia ichthyophaga]TIB53957.1 hypothetical protein E3P81_00492 [Wallemia ichthyophaga]TIB56429.1 hypothetical protein E3P80_00544 [Wallemia ichthyophaga]